MFDDDLRQVMNLKSTILVEISPSQDIPLNWGGLREENLLLEFRHNLRGKFLWEISSMILGDIICGSY